MLEQDGDAGAAEDDLANILKRAPDDADALNALGYTLTLHTTRYGEARGYIQRALHNFPKQGSKKPWRLHQNYVKDLMALRFGALRDGAIEYSGRGAAAKSEPDAVSRIG